MNLNVRSEISNKAALRNPGKIPLRGRLDEKVYCRHKKWLSRVIEVVSMNSTITKQYLKKMFLETGVVARQASIFRFCCASRSKGCSMC